MDLNVTEFVPDCDVFLVGHLVVFFFWFLVCYRYGDNIFTKSNS